MSGSNTGKIRLHHVGIAVSDMSDTEDLLGRLLGLSFADHQDVDAQKVRVAYSDGDGAALELIEATSDSSPLYPVLPHPIQAFIEKHGQGLHHLCFEVDDLDAVLERVAGQGVNTVGGGVLEGSHDGRVAFLSPNDASGLLIELREKTS